MNRKMLSVVLVIAMLMMTASLLAPVAASSSEESEGSVAASAAPAGDFKYSYTSDGTAVTITKYAGAGGAVVIPDAIDGKPVTTIFDYAFSGCTALTSIIIPDSVTAISYMTFSGCTALTSVTIPDRVTTIGKMAFQGCTALASVTIPDRVTTIGTSAFQGCTALTSVTIPDRVTTIGDNAFSGCTALTSVTIGDSVTTIGDNAFSGCTALTSVTIGDSVTTIGTSAFLRCTALTSVTIGSGVTTIGTSAFRGCANLTSVTLGSGVTTIGSSAFRGCANLTSIIIPDGVTTIGDQAFQGCANLTSVTLGSGVTGIGRWAFDGCANLTSVTIGNKVTTIGTYAFRGCSSLTAMVFDGNAPSSPDSNWLSGTPASLVIYHHAGATGFTSPTWQGKTTAVLPTPLAPQAVRVVAGDRQATLTWEAPSYTGDSAIDHYIVYQDGVDVKHVIGASAVIDGLVNGQSYEFKVAAHNAGGAGQNSSSFAVTPSAVTILSPGSSSHLNTNKTTVEWSFDGNDDIDHFLVVLDDEAPVEVPADTLSYLLRDLSDAVHVVTITAVTTGGTTFSSEVSFTVDTTAPTVTDKSPTGTDVAVDAKIAVTFSEEMDHGSVVITVNGANVAITWDGNAATASHELAYGTAYTVTVSGKDLAGNVLEGETSWSFTTLKDQGTISGIIKDEDGHVVADATVTLSNGMTTTTDAEGKYVFNDVAIGDYTLTVEKDGYRTVTSSVKVEAGKNADAGTVSLPAADGTPAGSVSGIIKDEDGHVVADATVTLKGATTVTTTTDAEGKYVFNDVAIGDYTLTVTKDGYRTVTSSVKVEAGKNADAGTVSLPAADGTPAGSVSGIIKDEDGHVVADATVTLSNGTDEYTTTTDQNGKYVFDHVPLGEYTLTVDKDGFETFTKAVKLTSDSVANGNVVDGALSKNEGSDGTLLIVGIVAIVIVVVLIAVMMVRRKKGGTNGRDGKGAEAKEGKE